MNNASKVELIDKNKQKKISEFFSDLQYWAGFKTKKELAKKIGIHASSLTQFETRFGNISVVAHFKIMQAFPNLPKKLKDDLDFLSKRIGTGKFPTSASYKLEPVDAKIKEVTLDYSSETVNVEYITSKVNAGNGYVEMNYPVTISISKFLIKKNNPEDVFAVTAHGDSMLLCGITDGTMLIAKKCSNIEECSGQIVIAIVDAEFIVKRLIKKPNGDYEMRSETIRTIPPIELKHKAFRIFGYVIHSINDY